MEMEFGRKGDLVANRDLFLLIPLLASLLAIVFDLGLFTGFDIGLFTVFSLSEHIAFALEVLPIAIVIAFVWMFVARLTPGGSLWTTFLGRMRPIFAQIVAALMLITAGALAFYYGYIWIAGTALSFAVSVMLFAHRSAWATTCSVIFLSIAVFAFGHDVATRLLQSNNPAKTLIQTSEGAVHARIIRSGERGILFYDPANHLVTFLKWDTIKQISRPAEPATSVAAAAHHRARRR